MNKISQAILMPLLAGAMAMSSCVGGTGGGVTGSGLVYGPISAFGSVIVGGIEFEVDDAVIRVDGQVATEADLRVGMLVEVRGLFDRATQSGTATSIVSDAQLRGPVEAIDVQNGELVVLGQLVVTDSGTNFDDRDIDQLEEGDPVRINAFHDADGLLHATLVSFQQGSQTTELEGQIEDFDAGDETFRISNQLVDFTSAQIVNAPVGGLHDGLFAEVRAGQTELGEALIADVVEIKDEQIDEQDGDEFEIEGVVTRVDSQNQFELGNRATVQYDSRTRFEGGTEANLAVNARVHVSGTLANGGILQAEKIEFTDEEDDSEVVD